MSRGRAETHLESHRHLKQLAGNGEEKIAEAEATMKTDG